MTVDPVIPNDAKVTMLGHALSYAKRGWPVFPVHGVSARGHCTCGKQDCTNVAKHPRSQLVPRGALDASTDLEQVTRWWTMCPGANIGIRTGAIDREGDATYLSVLDIDPAHGGDVSFERLTDAHGAISDTRIVLTGGGGFHYFFESKAPLRTTAGSIAHGIDTRGGGGTYGTGYVVAPPSMHRSGRRYEWELSSPETPCSAPAWLFLLANGATTSTPGANGANGTSGGEPVPASEQIVDGEQGGAGRKKTLHSIGRTMRARGLGVDEIHATLIVVNERRCIPPLDAKDVRRMAEQACKVPPGRSPEYEAKASRHLHAVPAPTAPSMPVAPRTREPGEDDGDEPSDANGTAWQDGLQLARDKHGNLRNTFANLCAILRHSPEYVGQLSYNEMTLYPCRDGVPMLEAQLGALREQIELRHGISPAPGNLAEAVLTIASERSFHPVRQYLESLRWDGTPRITALLDEVLHVQISSDRDRALKQRQLTAWFISAVARVLLPGCKVDNMLVLIGAQGGFKSTFFSAIAGREWFADTHMDLSKIADAAMQLRLGWLYEWGEIEKITGKRGADEVKAFLSTPVDTFRKPYGRVPGRVPRTSVIVGTTNTVEFLSDETGSRRFWIFNVTAAIEIATVVALRDQLWAEAVARLKNGEQWWLNAEEDDLRATQDRAHFVSDPWEQKIAIFIKLRSETTAAEVLEDCLRLETQHRNRSAEMRVTGILHRLHWKSDRKRRNGVPTRVWSKPSGDESSERADQ